MAKLKILKLLMLSLISLLSLMGRADDQKSPYSNVIMSLFHHSEFLNFNFKDKPKNRLQRVYLLNLKSSTRTDYVGWSRSEIQSELEKTAKIFDQCDVAFDFQVLEIDLGDFKIDSRVKSGSYMEGTPAFNYSRFSQDQLRDGPVIILVDKFIPEPTLFDDVYASVTILDGGSIIRKTTNKGNGYLLDTAIVYKRSITQNNSATYSTIAHELGHILMNADHFPVDMNGPTFTPNDPTGNLMANGMVANSRGFSTYLNGDQCQAVRAYKYAQ